MSFLNVKIEIEPIFKTQPPQLEIHINDDKVFTGEVDTIKIIEKQIPTRKNFNLKIQRLGRNKSIVLNDKDNSAVLKQVKIDDISIDPTLGLYSTCNNSWITEKEFYTNIFNLNGQYNLEIPFLTLDGECQINIPSNKHFDIAFFGASMTDWDFAGGIPPIYNEKNYQQIFEYHFKNKKIINLAKGGQSNQEIFDSIKQFLKNNNHSKVFFVQLISACGRQIKNKETKELSRYQIHKKTAFDKNSTDEFSGLQPKFITDYFVYLDITPILALQMPEYKDLIKLVEEKQSKIFFISYLLEEYTTYVNALPNNMAPYFDIDPNDPYVIENGYHATVSEHKKFAEELMNFYQENTLSTERSRPLPQKHI